MKKYILVGLCVAILLTLTLSVSAVDFDDSVIKGLNVTEDIDGALSEAQSQNKTVALIFDQDSCVYCDMLKKDVLSNQEIQKIFNENYIVVLVDINKHPDVAAKYEVCGTPMVQFLSPDGKSLDKIEGYVSSDEFLTTLKGI
jgi:thioredoxin-related protein